jgi:NitT/TauT family transport system substrate-binding protein
MIGTTRRTFAALALATGAFLGAAGTALAQTPVTVVVPNPSAITFLPMWVAIGEGYFEEEGIDLTVEAVDGSSSVLQVLSSGQGQIGAPGPGPVLAAQARGVDAVFFYNLYPKSVFGLVVEEDSPVQSPEELKGEVVGIGTADGAEASFTRAILTDLGLKETEDYTFLPVGDGGTATVAFMRDEVAAYAAAVSDAAILRSRGVPLREITPEKYLAFFGNGFAAMREYIEANPAVIEGFGRAMVRGMKFALDPANADAALDHAAVGNPQEGEDRDFARALLAAAAERMTPTDAFAAHGFGYLPPEHWELWHESAQASGALTAPLPDLAKVYTNDFAEGWNAD